MAKGVKTNITSHGSVKKRRAVQKWQGLALLGIEGKAGATRVGARSEGGGRASKDSGDGELHVDQGKGQRKWQGTAPCARSSHGVSGIGGKAYVFGGEAKARHA